MAHQNNLGTDIAAAIAAAPASRSVINKAHRQLPFPDAPNSLNSINMAAAQAEISNWDGYAPTALRDLPEIAAFCGVKSILYKDESSRFGLGSFKALGGAYAVADLITERMAQGVKAEDITVATATDGNHGRSVSWGAQRGGCNAKIYIHEHVSSARETAMLNYGADVIRVQGNYEASLMACKADATANGWYLVSDTSWDGYLDVPLKIMAGYTIMGEEVLAQMGDTRPTHAFLPVGVGGLGSGIVAPLWQDMGADLCRLISVESTMSSCFLDSIDAGTPTFIDIKEETLMAGLSCGEVSNLAWAILLPTLSHCMAISDHAVAPLMRWFAHRTPSIEAGECSVSGLAAMLQAHARPAIWADMDFDENSIILLIGTEGATDRELYDNLIKSA